MLKGKIDRWIIMWLIITTIALTLPIIFVKRYINSYNKYNLIIAILLYIVLVIGYAKVLQRYPIHYMYPLWFISMIIALFSGVLFFGEKMKAINIIGIILGLFSMYLVIK